MIDIVESTIIQSDFSMASKRLRNMKFNVVKNTHYENQTYVKLSRLSEFVSGVKNKAHFLVFDQIYNFKEVGTGQYIIKSGLNVLVCDTIVINYLNLEEVSPDTLRYIQSIIDIVVNKFGRGTEYLNDDIKRQSNLIDKREVNILWKKTIEDRGSLKNELETIIPKRFKLIKEFERELARFNRGSFRL